MTVLWILLFSLISFALPAKSGQTVSCAVCGMDTKTDARNGFESMHEGKTVHLCSFSCSLKFHAGHLKSPLYGHDFSSGAKVNVESAFFLMKSSKILKELEFGMPPSVVVFSSRFLADKTQAQVGDGEIIKGFEAAQKNLH